MKDEVNPYMLSPATLKALDRFGSSGGLNQSPTSKPELLPLPATDWELWAQMPKATLWEVVAVSLNLDPRAIKPPSKFAALTEPIYAAPEIEFDRRLKIACAHLGKTGPIKTLDFLPPEHLFDGPASATVSLPQFAQWALGMGWELPEKFPRFRAAPSVPETPEPAPGTSQSDAVQRVVKSAPQKLSAASVPMPARQAAPVVPASHLKPWLEIDPRDPTPEQPWYTPARYFARQLAIEKPTLLSNRELLADKVSTALFNAGFKKRGGKLRFDSGTVLKAFANVTLG